MRIARWAFALAMLASPAAADDSLPTPVVELLFQPALTNTGTLGGAGQWKDYAAGQEPLLTESPWGRALDLNAAARFGGESTKDPAAGSAVNFADARLKLAESFAFAVWLCPAVEPAPVAARALTRQGQWELACADQRFSLLAVDGKQKTSYNFARTPASDWGQWIFLAASYNRARQELTLYSGDRDGLLANPRVYDNVRIATDAPTELEVGNYLGLRPFKGLIDNVRVYEVALAAPQVRALMDRDMAGWSSGASAYELSAVEAGQPRFLPKHSHIFFSTRWQDRRRSEAMELMKTYHASHLLWVYGSNPEFVREVHNLGVFYQATLNGMAGSDHSAVRLADDTGGRQRDFDGAPIVLPHMQKWNNPPLTGCANNEAFRKAFLAEVEPLIKAGVDSIHIDDWEMTAGTSAAGTGCFCPACVAGFRDYLARHLPASELVKIAPDGIAKFDYRAWLREQGVSSAAQYQAEFNRLALTPQFLDFQREGVRQFYRQLRQALDGLSPGKYITLSANAQFRRRDREGTLHPAYAADLFDFFNGEATQSMQSAGDYVLGCKLAEAYRLPQIMQTKPKGLARPRAALATSYAMGQWFLVPWDLYMDNDPATGKPAPRYYSAPADWSDLYGFVHARPQLFDGFNTAVDVVLLAHADDPDATAPLRRWCLKLAAMNVPFRVALAADRWTKMRLSAGLFQSAKLVIEISPADRFSPADRKVLADLRAARNVRLVAHDRDVDTIVAATPLVRFEGPPDIYCVARVRPDAAAPAMALHLVNWNVASGGDRTETFQNVAVSLLAPARFGTAIKATYFQPGQAQAQSVKAESHRNYWRVVVPNLNVWGVLLIEPDLARVGAP